jgi:hypothetical protein
MHPLLVSVTFVNHKLGPELKPVTHDASAPKLFNKIVAVLLRSAKLILSLRFATTRFLVTPLLLHQQAKQTEGVGTMDVIQMNVQHIRAFNEDVRERYDYASRAQMALCLLFMSAAYLHTVVRRLSPGLKAFLSIIPVVLVNIWLPMLFSSSTEVVSRVVSSTSWQCRVT